MKTEGPSWKLNKHGQLISKATGSIIRLHAFSFPDFLPPNGYLANHPGCFALWYYACLVKQQYAKEIDELQYDDVWPFWIRMENLKNLFLSIARMYDVTPEQMLQFWINVDMQCISMKSPKVPKKFRMDGVMEIKTQ